jgi:hypoxanthine-DNA glycosylase
MTMSQIESFAPIVTANSCALVLGSMPGILSLESGEYYAHPRNAFWRIMGKLFNAGPELPYEVRIDRLKLAGVAIWDTLQGCIRPGSLDADIKDEVANDFRTFFSQYPSISHVFFNGSKSEATFRRHVLPSLSDDARVYVRLPSTSPAHAGITFDERLRDWRAIAKVLNNAAPHHKSHRPNLGKY